MGDLRRRVAEQKLIFQQKNTAVPAKNRLEQVLESVTLMSQIKKAGGFSPSRVCSKDQKLISLPFIPDSTQMLASRSLMRFASPA